MRTPMPLSPFEREIQALIKLEKSRIALIKNGVRIEQVCGRPIDDLVIVGCVARFGLAKNFFDAARRLRRMKPALHRNSISRSYYSMYHSARAISYLMTPGDDHQEHKDLHKGIPEDFPNREQWQNDLKGARLQRNEADYEPYPSVEAEFGDVSRTQLAVAADFLAVSELYLRGKGCPL